MANIDITELLSDPDFVDQVVLVHRTPVVNALGENVLTSTRVGTIGSVQPASGKTLARLPDALRSQNVSSFWIKAEIVSDGNCKYPDVIEFRGRIYAVQNVLDYLNWGQGWTEGTCIVQKPIS